MKFEAVLRGLARAEKTLRIDGLTLLLQSDGSGAIRTFEDVYVFKFDNHSDLTIWLQKPSVVEYDSLGDAIIAMPAHS